MRKVKLSSLCKISNGFAFKSDDYVNHGYRVMRITNVQKGFVVDNDPKFIPQEIADKANGFKLYAGDILVSLTGNVGRIGVIQPQHLPAVLNQRVGLIRPSSEEINEKYLFQYLNSDNFEREAIRNSNGVAQLNLSSKWIESHEIPLPPLDDQKRIAHLLGKVERLIAQRKQHLQQLDELLKSVFLEMFGDPVRNEKKWEKVPLQNLCLSPKNIKCGPFGTQLNKSELQKDGIPVWGIPQINSNFAIPPNDFITQEKAIELEEYSVRQNDIVMSRKGTVGKCALYSDTLSPGIMHSDVLRIRADWNKTNPVYLCWQLRLSRDVERQIANVSSGAIMAGINVGKLKLILVFTPPIDF